MKETADISSTKTAIATTLLSLSGLHVVTLGACRTIARHILRRFKDDTSNINVIDTDRSQFAWTRVKETLIEPQIRNLETFYN